MPVHVESRMFFFSLLLFMVCMIGADNTFFFEEFYYMVWLPILLGLSQMLLLLKSPISIVFVLESMAS